MKIRKSIWSIGNLMLALAFVLTLLAGVPADTVKAAGPVTVDKGDVALSGGFQAGNFSEVWDLTAGDLTISFIYNGNGLVDDDGAHAWAELGVRDMTTTSNFNPNNTGIWLATDYQWLVNTFDPDVTPTLDLDDKLLLQKAAGNGEGAYDLPSTPPAPGNNHRFWWDRDGVDPWQNGETANTLGIYPIAITLHATSAKTGTAYMTINGLSQGFEVDGNWSTIELMPAGMSFLGDMTHMQVFYGIYGYGATHSIGFEDITIAGFPFLDLVGPNASNVLASPNPTVVGSTASLTATITDPAPGTSDIASAEYILSSEELNWPASPMAATDGAFDEATEEVSATFSAPGVPGVYNLCVQGTDAASNAGAPKCTMLVVYDPTGGFLTGGGWIWSSAGQTVPAFSSIPASIPGSFPSLGYEATSTDEAGDHIAFAGTDRALQTVTVNLTDWACENDFTLVNGAWVHNRDGYAGEPCLSTPGSGFTQPITLNIYQVDNSGPAPAAGSLIATKTQAFFIPFRPSWDNAMCTETGQTPATDKPFGGKWYDPVLGQCVHGFAFNIDFDFSADGITLPDEVIYGVAYDTSHYGAAPLGANGPYDSLNLSFTSDAPSIGTDVENNAVFWDTSYGSFYCDGGAGGADTFRWDAGCWEPYDVPVVQFNVQTEGAYKGDPSLEGQATFGFVSKYKKGTTVPEGNTAFEFEAGNMDFHSTSYEWLVVNQASSNAQFKGYGTINGSGNYGFMIWAGDGDPDTFRIKIWDAETEVVVYDNGVKQPIGGGSIVVHNK